MQFHQNPLVIHYRIVRPALKIIENPWHITRNSWNIQPISIKHPFKHPFNIHLTIQQPSSKNLCFFFPTIPRLPKLLLERQDRQPGGSDPSGGKGEPHEERGGGQPRSGPTGRLGLGRLEDEWILLLKIILKLYLWIYLGVIIHDGW